MVSMLSMDTKCLPDKIIAAAEMIRDGFNDIDGYQVFARENHRGEVQLGPRSGAFPSMIVVSNDNPYLPLTPGTTRGINFAFHRNYFDNAVRVCTSEY